MMNRVEMNEEMMEAVVGCGSWGENLWNRLVDTVMPITTDLYEYFSKDDGPDDGSYQRWY